MTTEELIAEARAAHCSLQGEEETDPDDGVCPDCWEDVPCLTIRLVDALERAEKVVTAARLAQRWADELGDETRAYAPTVTLSEWVAALREALREVAE